MLPVFHRPPRATPFESVLQKEAVQKVAFDDFIRKGLATVDVFDGGSRFDDAPTILSRSDIRIVERVDIDSHACSVFGELGRARYPPIAKTGGIIITHGPLVVSLVVIHQTDPLDGILLTIEFTEYLHNIIRNGLVTDHLTHVFLLFGIEVREAQITEIGPADRAAFWPRTTLHSAKNRVGDGLYGELLSPARKR